MDTHSMMTRTVATIVGTVVGIIIIILGFQIFQRTFSRASDELPRDVIVSEIGQNNVKVTWASAVETQGVIEYGTSPTALNFFAPESQKATSHSVDLTLLSPATTYYFQIRVGDKKYDNGGVPWTFTTKGTDKTQSSGAAETPITTRPTPVATIVINQPQTSPTTAVATCNETDCEKIKTKLGKGCTTQDYFECKAKK